MSWRGVMECVRRDDLDPSFKMFNRIARIQAQLLAVWEVLSTMTPFDYSAFRNALGRSSGFQSQQYRLLEFVLGNKHAAMIEVHQRSRRSTPSSSACWKCPASMTRCCDCSRGAVTGCPPMSWCAISLNPTKPASKSPPRGWLSITTPKKTGTSTSWPSSWSTWIIGSSCGASST